MPLTSAGKKTLANFVKEYGSKLGKKRFYMSINSGKLNAKQMHGEKKGKG